MKKYIIILVGIAAALIGKFVVGPQLAVTASNSLGMGWDSAKPELIAKFTSIFTTSDWTLFDLDQPDIEKLSDCCATKAIAFLNTTDCSYLYSEATTTKEEHIKNQDACMKKVNYGDVELKFTLECARENFPKDWKLIKSMLMQEFESSFTKNGVPAAQAKMIADCIANRSVTLANNRKCPIINKQAQNFEELINGFDGCVKDPDNDPEFQKILEDCKDAQL